MVYHVYVLYSPSTDKFYKGQTSDLEDRLNRHNNGGEISTKSGSPWTLVWRTEKANRSEAMVLEKKLKHLSRERMVRFMLKYSSGIPTDALDLVEGFLP